jgi:ubiquinone biosynthesis protein
LQKLQTNVPSDEPAVVRATVEGELERPIDELFTDFDPTPLASASIGQVHRARLASGEDVVIKVQHAGIRRRMEVDLEILSGLAQLADGIPELKLYRPQSTVAEFRRLVRRELDFAREARNLQQFARDFARSAHVRIPKSYPELSTSRVLTGFYHGDPHPGNLVVLPGGAIGLLDFGLVGRLDESLREDIEDMLSAIVSQDAQQLTALVMRLGAVPSGFDEAALSVDLVCLALCKSAGRSIRSGWSADGNDRNHSAVPHRAARIVGHVN